MCPRDGGFQCLARPAGSEVTLVPVDPVTDQLDPPVATPRLLFDIGDELLRLDLPAVVAQITLGASDVPPGPDDPWQAVALVDPSCVRRRAGVADQQRPGVPVGDRLLLGDVVGHGSVGIEAHMTVQVDQSWQHPAIADRLGAGNRLIADHTASHPQVAMLLVGQNDPTDVQRLAHQRLLRKSVMSSGSWKSELPESSWPPPNAGGTCPGAAS